MDKDMVLRFIFGRLFVFLIILVISNGQSWRINDEGCITPNGETGNCIPVRTCPPMMTALLSVKRPLSEVARQQLEAYICSVKEDYKVCCPPGSVDIREDNNPIPDDIPAPVNSVDITRHPNYRLLPTDCGAVDLTSIRVINGENADLSEFPWMALLSYRQLDNRAQFKCGGTIINNRYILTAAHCLEERSKLLGVRLGEYDISTKIDCFRGICNDPLQDVAIEEIILHPNYQTKGKINDIGLLRVTPIKLNDKNIRPICLPRGKLKELKADYVEVSGWGVTQQFSTRISDILQKAYLRIVDNNKCQEVYKKFPEIKVDDTQICAGGGKNKSNACKGDSGGPIQVQERFNNIVRYIQHGIVSVGMSKCDTPAVFTKVAYYMDWILDNMKP